eukprot:TRINITY_DN922_c0_g2_i1.p1 TRINITY_DN922_c0_g2~~TRINITY_DN922_c0_g2_i1.p1  ORF type:complete len:583 (+),score=77.10 TRINITY_DN922_c0_g2_i1:243-1991(+)
MNRSRTEQHRDIRSGSTEAYDEFKGRTIVVDLAEVDPQTEDFDGRGWLEQRTRDQLPLGWDLEWVPDRTKEADNPIALMQFADETTAMLIRTHKTRNWLPSAVLQALLSEDCKKISVGWDGNDKQKMQRTFHIEPHGIIDLAVVAREKKGLAAQGLKALSGHFGMNMKKESRVARSNWACTRLTRDQIQYAADDAYFTYILAEKLDRLPDMERLVEEKQVGAQAILEMSPGWDEQGIERRHDGLWCTICNRGPMTVPQVVDVHLGCQKHKKHMEAKSGCEAKNGGLELPPEYEAQGIVAGDGLNGAKVGEYRCKLCNAGPFTAKTTVDAHVGSKKHQKALLPAAEAASAVEGGPVKPTYEDVLWNLPDYVRVHEGATLECTLCSSRMNTLAHMHVHVDSNQHSKKCRALNIEEVIYIPSKGLLEVLSTGQPVVRQGFTQPRRRWKSGRTAVGLTSDCGLRRESGRVGGTTPICVDAQQRSTVCDRPVVALPPGWREALDPKGQVFYADLQTKVSQRTPPDHYVTVPWRRCLSDTGLAYWVCPSLGDDYIFYESQAGYDWERLMTKDKVYWSNETLHVRFWEK